MNSADDINNQIRKLLSENSISINNSETKEIANYLVNAWNNTQNITSIEHMMRRKIHILQYLQESNILTNDLSIYINYEIISKCFMIKIIGINDHKSEIKLVIPLARESSSNTDARNSQGFINSAQNVTQDNSTNHSTTNSGDIANRDINHSTHYIFQSEMNDRISIDQLQEFNQIIQSTTWTEQQLWHAYDSSKPEMWRFINFQAKDEKSLLVMMIQDLNQAPKQRNGNFPIIYFFANLLSYLKKGDIYHHLEHWIRSIEYSLGSKPSLHTFTRPLSTSSIIYVLIKIELDVHIQDKYLIAAWISKDSQTYQTLDLDISIQDQRYDLSDIPLILSLIMNKKLNGVIPYSEHIVLEWLIPSKLLTADLDQWDSNIGEVDEPPWPIGHRHPVVVRLLERVINEKWKRPWHAAQEWFQALDENKSLNPAIRVRSISECEHQSLYASLHSQGCLALEYALEDLSGQQYRDICFAILKAGTPTALLPRRTSGDPSEVNALLSQLIEDGGRLLSSIHRKRACAKPTESLYHLTILWDDPNRPLSFV